jgi:F-type H+-transporting ATPase subunit delta
MPKVDDKVIGVARVYCQALLDLAERQGTADTVLAELGEIAGLAETDAAFAQFIESPLVDPKDREHALETMFRGRASDVLVDALQVMNRKGRLAVLPTMAELFYEEHEALRGRLDVHVASAVQLSEKLRERLRRTIARSSGKEVVLHERLDEGMVGGIVVRIGDRKIDASVRYQIAHLREIFHDRARQHIYESRMSEPLE